MQQHAAVVPATKEGGVRRWQLLQHNNFTGCSSNSSNSTCLCLRARTILPRQAAMVLVRWLVLLMMLIALKV